MLLQYSKQDVPRDSSRSHSPDGATSLVVAARDVLCSLQLGPTIQLDPKAQLRETACWYHKIVRTQYFVRRIQ